jgi:hypothetical protein
MYDVVVIGNDISSQVAALAASCFGHKVVLIKDGGETTAQIHPGPFFSPDPLPLTGFQPGQTMAKLTEFLGLDPQDILFPSSSPEPLLQLIFPDKRLDIVTDMAHQEEEWSQAFPRLRGKGKKFHQVTKQANSLVDENIAHFFDCWRNSKHPLPSAGSDLSTRGRWIAPSVNLWRLAQAEPAIPAAATSLGLVTSYLHVESYLQTAAAYALALPWRISPPFPQNRRSIYSWFEKMNRSRSQVLDKVSVMRLKIRNDIKIDVQMDGSTEVLKSRYLVLSSNWEKSGLLVGKDWQKALSPPVRRMEPAFFPLHLHVNIPDRIIPEPMAPCLVYHRQDRGISREANYFFLESTVLNYHHSPDTRRGNLTISVFTRVPPWRMTIKELKMASSLALDGVYPLLPFLKDQVNQEDISFSLGLSRKIQEVVNPYYVMKRQYGNNLKLLTPATGFGNVLLAGGMLGAGFGFEGELLSGLGAACQLTRKEE